MAKASAHTAVGAIAQKSTSVRERQLRKRWQLRFKGPTEQPGPSETDHPTSNTVTPIPSLYDDWKSRTVGQTGTDEQARAIAERERQRVRQLPDPFTPLATLSCDERRATHEQVVWEDDALMALVDRFGAGAELLITPKSPVNFFIDLSKNQLGPICKTTDDFDGSGSPDS